VTCPDTLARAGYEVHVHGGPGPEDYSAYRWDGDEGVVERIGRPPGRQRRKPTRAPSAAVTTTASPATKGA
jgi:hypothetical protein